MPSRRRMSSRHRFAALQEYYPEAKPADWQLEIAGQRVQIIKPDPQRVGFLEFGTELVTAADHSMVALLGASPGASTAVFIAISLLEKCFKSELTENGWLPKLKEMIPSYGESLIENAELCRRVRAEAAAVLHLENIGGSGSAKIGDDRAAGIDNTAERALGSR